MDRQTDAGRGGAWPIDACFLGVDHGDFRVLRRLARPPDLRDGLARPLHPAHRRADLFCIANAHATDALLTARDHGHRIREAGASKGVVRNGNSVAAWRPECPVTTADLIWADPGVRDNRSGARRDGLLVAGSWP